MRALPLIAFVFAAACGGGGPTGGDDDVTPDADNPQPVNGFRVTSPDVTIDPNTEITYCYYFRTPNTATVNVNKWVSDMTPGSHHMIMFLTNGDLMPPGTLSTSNCGFGGAGTNLPVWTYAAQTPHNELALPTDDGAGKPLAQQIKANTAAFFQMHYLNATDAPLTVHVQLDADGLDAATAFTQTDAFITFNGGISIPPMTNNVKVPATANTPPNTKFWLMSTHAHKQAVLTDVKDGADTVFMSTDWEHPGAATFMTPDTFFTFASGKLTYECTYNNPTNRTIQTGDSAQTDEMCMATGYFFPGTGPKFCYSTSPTQTFCN